MFRKLFSTTNEAHLAILRVVLGIVFLAHGLQKTVGWFGGYGFSGTMAMFTGAMHIPALFAFLAIMAEFLGGIGLVLGALTRIAAFSIFFEMLVAVYLVHFQFGFFMNWGGTQKGEGIEYHLLVLAITAVLMLRGAGAWSIDRLLSGSKPPQS